MPHSSRHPESAAAASVAILGADAMLAARPATPVQLAHACLVAGYSAVFPASWGDELVAAGCLDRVARRGREPAIACACPLVEERLLAAGPDLAPYLIPLIAPPVAAARYLRALYGHHGVRITYIGDCPGASDPAIDVRVAPNAFLTGLADREIDPSEQPYLFDSVIPPDRRRYFSLPGGLPAPQWLNGNSAAHQLVEIASDNISVQVAQLLIEGKPMLVDISCGVGCRCSGATGENGSRSSRQQVLELEPPRSRNEILDPSLSIELDRPLRTDAPQVNQEIEITEEAPVTAFVPHVSLADMRATASADFLTSDALSEPIHVPDAEFPEQPDEPPLFDSLQVPEEIARASFAMDAEQAPAAEFARLTAHPPTTGAPRRNANPAPIMRVAKGKALPRAYVSRRRQREEPRPEPVIEPVPVTPVIEQKAAPPVPVAEPVRHEAVPIPVTEPVEQDEAPPMPAAEPVQQAVVPTPTSEPVADTRSETSDNVRPPRTVTIPLPQVRLEPVPHPGSSRRPLFLLVAAIFLAIAALVIRSFGSGNNTPASAVDSTASGSPEPASSIPAALDSINSSPVQDSAALNIGVPDSTAGGSGAIDSSPAVTERRPLMKDTAARSQSDSAEAARLARRQRRARIDSMVRDMRVP